MNTALNSGAYCYGLYDGDMIIGFCSVIHFPHPTNPKIKHIHRLVIHPDYQGIGLGKKLLNFVAELWKQKGYDVSLITSAKNLIFGLNKDSHWGCTHYGKLTWNKSKTAIRSLVIASSKDRITASFKYIGEKGKK